MTIEEMEARKAQIKIDAELEDADLDALEAEVRAISDELETRKAEEAKKEEIRKMAAEQIVSVPVVEEAPKMESTFAETRKTTIDTKEVRSLLVSGGTVATPTGVSGINNTLAGAGSILDYVKVVNCAGMGSNKVAYIAADAQAAADQTEGSAATAKEATYGYVTITPDSVAVTAQISKQAKKQSPLDYEAKVTDQAVKSLRKAVSGKIVAALKASSLTSKVAGKIQSSKGVIDEQTLRKLALSYGGNEDVVGGAVLFLNKTDLIAFGDVRGTNEKKAVYEITPDAANPNAGTITDGGLTVKYCLVNGLTAYAGASVGTSSTVTMFYGDPNCFELDLFSDYEVRVSEDFAITSLMDTIVGDVEVGGDVVVKDGFVTLAL